MVDEKKPTPICSNGVNTVIMNGDARQVAVWVSDLIQSTSLSDNCTSNENLTVTISLAINPNPTVPAIDDNVIIRCEDMIRDTNTGVALPTFFPVHIFVTDEAGNFAFCTSTIEVRDNGNDCGITANGSSGTISGRIFNEQDEDLSLIHI